MKESGDQENLAEFLNAVFSKDQSDPQRSNALECYQMLIERMEEFVSTPMERGFWNAVSLESFHIAQSEALKGNVQNAIKYLEISLEAAGKGLNQEWEAYVRGTKCYFENDIEGLRIEIPRAGENGKVLNRLLNGYLSRGAINYREDYLAS